MQCIVCGEETKIVKIFDRVTAGFCHEHYPEENEIKNDRRIVLEVFD